MRAVVRCGFQPDEWADNLSSLHKFTYCMSTGIMPDHTGRQDARRGGVKLKFHWDQFPRNFLADLLPTSPTSS